jgi:hypothetical protein
MGPVASPLTTRPLRAASDIIKLPINPEGYNQTALLPSVFKI